MSPDTHCAGCLGWIERDDEVAKSINGHVYHAACEDMLRRCKSCGDFESDYDLDGWQLVPGHGLCCEKCAAEAREEREALTQT